MDALTQILLPYMLFTIPAQYLFMSLEYGLKSVSFLYYLTFIRSFYKGDILNGEDYSIETNGDESWLSQLSFLMSEDPMQYGDLV